MFVAGLLMAGHAPFQYWRYSSQWHNPDRKGPVDVNSKDYKIAVDEDNWRRPDRGWWIVNCNGAFRLRLNTLTKHLPCRKARAGQN